MEKVVVKYSNGKFIGDIENPKQVIFVGRYENNKVELSPEEALYLLEKNKVLVEDKNETIEDFNDFLVKYGDIISFKTYLAFKDIRNRGYYADVIGKNRIIVHMKGDRNNPEYMCVPFLEFEEISWNDVLNLLNEAINLKAKLLFALIDIEFDIVYYEVRRWRL